MNKCFVLVLQRGHDFYEGVRAGTMYSFIFIYIYVYIIKEIVFLFFIYDHLVHFLRSVCSVG